MLDKGSGAIILNHMVKYSEAALDATFSALSDPTRRGILARLARGPSSVMGLAEPFNVSLPAISKHLRVLERAGPTATSRASAAAEAAGKAGRVDQVVQESVTGGYDPPAHRAGQRAKIRCVRLLDQG